MALPPLPPSNTARYKLFYSVGGLEHSMQMRVDATNPLQSTVEAGYSQFLSDLAADLWLVTKVRLEFAPAGSDIFNPITNALPASWGAGSPSPEEAIRSISFTGRSSDGRKNRIFVYGFKANKTDNMRIQPAENANVGNALVRLGGFLHLFVCISGVKPVFNSYGNVDYNDHWQQEIR